MSMMQTLAARCQPSHAASALHGLSRSTGLPVQHSIRFLCAAPPSTRVAEELSDLYGEAKDLMGDAEDSKGTVYFEAFLGLE